MSAWSTFVQDLESFFSSVGQTFLTNIKAAFPALEQAALNFLSVVVDAIVTGIANGTIPLPALAAEPGATVDTLALGKLKRDTAYTLIQAELAKNPPPVGMTISSSLIYSAIEISYQKHQQLGNQGNFPGGNSGPQ